MLHVVTKFQIVPPYANHPVVHVTVLGVGLVGGSIALGLRSAGYDVVVYDTDAETRSVALRQGFNVADSPAQAVARAEVVFISVPLENVQPLALMIRSSLLPGCIVTDTCSVKRPVQGLPGLLAPSGAKVILGHPMAGSHGKGFSSARKDLFQGCTWILCDAGLGRDAGRLVSLLHRLGVARVLDCPTDVHDTLVAAVSHLPQVASSALAATVGFAAGTVANGALEVAGGGFRDSTRLAESPYDLWKPILQENAPVLAMLLDDFSQRVSQAAASLRSGSLEPLALMFAQGAECRDVWRASLPMASPAHDAIVPPMPIWTDEVSGHQAWLDRMLAWETVRTSAKLPAEHVQVSCRYLAHLLGIPLSKVPLSSQSSHAAVAAAYLTRPGMPIVSRSTWTADGLYVEGIDLPDGRFIVVI